MKRVWPLLACLGAARAQEMPPAPVVVAEVVEREVLPERPFVGTVEPVRRAVVGSEAEGFVVDYLVEEGQRVDAGAPLARLRTKIAETRLDAARAELAMRQEELRELRNGSRPEELAQARARFAAARASNTLRQWRLDRAQKLFETNVISEDEFKEARMTADVAEELLAEADAALRLAEAGPRAERIAQAEARLAAQEAEVARLADELERYTVRAPFAGYVVAKRTEAGEWVDKGAPVAEIVALDEVDVVVPVVEDYVLGVKAGMPASAAVGALAGRRFEGTVVAVVPSADARARTFPVKVRVKNPRESDGPLLKAGMFATVHLPVGARQHAILVPKDALVLGGAQPVVFVVGEDGKVTSVPVETGPGVDGLIQVKGGVSGGQKVVVRGNERLREGQPVRVDGTER